jgi:hypothetical protein
VIFGVGGPLVIGLGAILIGIPLMLLYRWKLPAFFTRKPAVADPALRELGTKRLQEARALLGSTPHKLLDLSDRPVLVVAAPA